MLSTAYRLRLEYICDRIVKGEEVKLEDMIWSDKLAKANRSAGEMLRKARRRAANPDMLEGSMDDFLNQLDLGDPDPANHLSSDANADDIAEWFRPGRPADWRQHD